MAGGGLLASLGLDLPPLEPGERWDPGLFGPDSTVWRIGRERILLAGGPAALLLQIAHPLVAAGVTNHSGFSEDPFLRLRATLDATSGSRSETGSRPGGPTLLVTPGPRRCGEPVKSAYRRSCRRPATQ